MSAVRIQEYLSRTKELRWQRAASVRLARTTECLTDTAANDAALQDVACQVHPEAGQADGVVHLKLDLEDPEDPAVGSAVGILFNRLRKELPAAELVAGWARGDAYVDAAPQIREAIDTHQQTSRRSLPPTADLPPADRCEICGDGVSPVTPAGPVTVEYPDNNTLRTKRACWDCHARHELYEGENGERIRHPAEARLAKYLSAVSGIGKDRSLVNGFNDLDALGPDVRGLSNHLATVKIDGNRVGHYFSELAREGVPGEVRGDISLAITSAAKSALDEATKAIHRDGEEMVPVIPHVEGGDDVLVSVPAGRAWPFTLRYLASFESLMKEHLTRIGQQHGDMAGWPDPPTASAGVVFAPTRHPLAVTSELAEETLRRAKTQHPGESAVGWADITRDGTTVPDHRQTYTVEELRSTRAGKRRVLDALVKDTANSRLHRLTAAVNTSPNHVTSLGRLRQEIQRLGLHPDVATYINSRTPVQVPQIRDLLDLARWWRSA